MNSPWSPTLDGGCVTLSLGNTEHEEAEGDDLRPAKAVQTLKNSLASRVFLEMIAFLRSLRILFTFEVCPQRVSLLLVKAPLRFMCA